MQPETKKLGELLVDAGLLSIAQLQEALRYQRVTGGRMGSNLVSLGFIGEDVLMDFLSQHAGVPRMDLRNLEVPPSVLERIPRRLADQLNVLPVAIKEPKSLVLAMADPSDLNAIDSARFASGMNIEPVVASYASLKNAIQVQYHKLDILSGKSGDAGQRVSLGSGLPVPMDFQQQPVKSIPKPSGMPFAPVTPLLPSSPKDRPKDPFFADTTGIPALPPGTFFGDSSPDLFSELQISPAPPPPPAQAPKITPEPPMVIHERGSSGSRVPHLESYKTRTLILGLIRLLQRRGVLSEEELTRLIQNLIDSKEIKDLGNE
jgi:hypothetical protein